MNDYKDEELMIMFKNENPAAFDLLFERYRGPVFGFIFRMLGYDREAAEDLYQEIFIKVFKGRDFYEPSGKFSAWLFTIARNHCLNYLKSRRYLEAQRTQSLDEVQSKAGQEAAAPNPENNPGTDREILDEAIAELPEKYREVFLLHAVEELPHEEIAGILDMNAATVRTNYHRARRLLREKLGPVLS
ncbi:RNA polymerase sigma factor [Planctomycetota bacterium]